MKKKISLNYRNIPNWGDQLNPYLAKKLFFPEFDVLDYSASIIPENVRKKIFELVKCKSLFSENVQLIGSIVGYCNPNSTILGSGLISSKVGKYLPKKVLATRGKLTSDILQSHGVTVPKIYCDPGIFISEIYNKDREKTHEIGIVPHYTELDNAKSMFEGVDNIKIISVKSDIEPFCDDILSCNRVISSSLHGLVAADSFGIPSAWVTFGFKLIGDDFKFLDYYSGAINNISPVRYDCLSKNSIQNIKFNDPSVFDKQAYIEQVETLKKSYL